jgi:hypothetical protein
MSWSAVGTRIVTGQDESEEPRVVLIGITWTAQTRTVTLERAEWVGLTQAGALAKTATATWTIVSRDRVGPSGQWVVREEKRTNGAWS